LSCLDVWRQRKPDRLAAGTFPRLDFHLYKSHFLKKAASGTVSFHKTLAIGILFALVMGLETITSPKAIMHAILPLIVIGLACWVRFYAPLARPHWRPRQPMRKKVARPDRG